MTYAEKLYAEYWTLYRKVKANAISFEDRLAEIDRITREYALAHDVAYEQTSKEAINYKDSEILARFADLAMNEILTWSHADKMSIVDYPIMSDSQEEERRKRYCLVPDVIFGDRRGNGSRTYSYSDEEGNVANGKARITLPRCEDYDKAEVKMIVRDALVNAGLTERQKEVIYLSFYKRLTQAEIAETLGVNKSNINVYLKAALKKLRTYLEKLGVE